MNTQPIIIEDNPQPFVVRVKLLTNQVHEFEVNKQMKVAQFKTLISPKVNVPVDRMRIVFAGKQLLDDKPLSEYVSESGMTVHLIARTAPQPQQNQPASTSSSLTNPQNSTSPASNTQPVPNPPSQGIGQPPLLNPLSDVMGMVSSLFGGVANNSQQSANSPQITMAFGNLGGPNNGSLGGLLSSLGMRMQTPPTQTSPQQPQSQPQANQGQQPGQQPPQQPANQARIQYSQLSQLNQALNNLIVPLDNVTTQQQTLTPQGVIRYLRRLHHQSSRSLLQLNRLLNLAESNHHNTENLESFIPVLQAMNSANNVAINSLTQLRNQRPRHHNHSQSQSQSHSQQINIQQTGPLLTGASQGLSQNQPIPQVSVSMNLTISEQIDQQPINNQPQSAQTWQLNQPQSQPQVQPHPHQQSQPQPPQMQMPMNPMSILGNLDLGSLMGGLNSVGGVNGLFGMSLREMMAEDQNPGIFLQLFGGMTGQNMMQMFTTKDFKFLKEKHPEIRSKLRQKISESGEQQLIEKITNQVAKIIVPNEPHPRIPDLKLCSEICRNNIKKHVKQLIKLSLSQNEPQYDVKAVQISKKTFCENIKIISQHTTNNHQNVAFEIIKSQCIKTMDPILPGISFMFYGLIQRDLFRVYNQFKAEEERRKKMSNDDVVSEQQLIDIIKEAGAKDAQNLAKVQHSKKYFEEQQ